MSQLEKTKAAPSWHREFKLSGQIGEPGQTEKLTFVSLMHQTDSAFKRGYNESEIVDAVIRAISPYSSIDRLLSLRGALTNGFGYHFAFPEPLEHSNVLWKTV